jgi:hypothetical protein
MVLVLFHFEQSAALWREFLPNRTSGANSAGKFFSTGVQLCTAGTASICQKATMRWIVIIGIFAALGPAPAAAMDAYSPCAGLSEERGWTDDLSTQGRHLAQMTSECEMPKNRELRLHLLSVPQQGEDPVMFSIGVKGNGAVLRLKIPFSF